MASYDILPALFLPFILLAGAVLLKGWKMTSRLPFPPGPKPRFIIGNLYDIPPELPWITYTEWGKQYGALNMDHEWRCIYLPGDVVHAKVFGAHVLILNLVKAATELLEKRAAIYSDRPRIPIVPLMGGDFSLILMPHSEKWRQHKRLFHEHFRKEAIALYRPVQLRKIHDLLHNLLSTPEDFVAHAKT
ncbi:cytochrome P450 [Mycena galopus ATCC 62051]|nr:cytochrome P450 [Mycena galopus ATCC 62051]